jgi:hypothetical protein
VKFKHYILPGLIFIVLVQCGTNEPERQTPQVKLTITPELLPLKTEQNATRHPSLCGLWTYGIFMYSRTLKLYNDGTFSFFDQGCLGKGYSEGKWSQIDNEVILTSFDKYKQEQKPVEVTESKPVEITEAKPVKTIHKKKKPKSGLIAPDFTLDFTNLASPVSSFKMPDSTNIYFDHAMFIYDGRNLYEFGKDGTQTKYIATSDNQ